jgi:hypothetical protein
MIDRSTGPAIRRIDGQILRFLEDGTVEVKIHKFFFQLAELEPGQKERLSPAIRQAITTHWLDYVNDRGRAYNRSLSAANAVDSYQSELRDLNRFRTPRPCRFLLREIAGEFVRFDNVTGEVAIRIDGSYLRPGDIPADRLGQINRLVFTIVENFLRDWRP